MENQSVLSTTAKTHAHLSVDFVVDNLVDYLSSHPERLGNFSLGVFVGGVDSSDLSSPLTIQLS